MGAKKEGPVERGRRKRRERMDAEKSERHEFYAQNPHSVLPSRGVREGWNAGSKGHMGTTPSPPAKKKKATPAPVTVDRGIRGLPEKYDEIFRGIMIGQMSTVARNQRHKQRLHRKK